MSFSARRSFFYKIVIAFLLLQGCQTVSQQPQQTETKPVKREIDYVRIFESALKQSGNKLAYKLQTKQFKEGDIVHSAEFTMSKKTSFQKIDMILLASGACTEDTLPQNLKIKNLGVGPGGASFNLSFCAGNQSIRLVDSNRLSMSDHPHGISLATLAKNIQIEFKK